MPMLIHELANFFLYVKKPSGVLYFKVVKSRKGNVKPKKEVCQIKAAI